LAQVARPRFRNILVAGPLGPATRMFRNQERQNLSQPETHVVEFTAMGPHQTTNRAAPPPFGGWRTTRARVTTPPAPSAGTGPKRDSEHANTRRVIVRAKHDNKPAA